jgi:SAM-dependent methyltransferase
LAGNISARAIRARPAIARLITPRNLNIVIDRLELAEAERFDLIVATNVLTYYDPFEQSLALTNIAALLRRGGILLSNDPLVVLPSVPFERVGSSAVQYSDLPNSRDEVTWYVRR